MKITKNIIIAILAGILLTGSFILWNLSLENRIELIQKDPDEINYKQFKAIAPENFHSQIHKKYCESVYVLDCRVQYNEYNCSVFVAEVLKNHGAKIDLKNKRTGKYVNTDELYKKFKYHSYKLKSTAEIDHICVAFFKPNGNDIPHVAFVERANHRRNLLIIEMNVSSGGINYRWLKFKDWRIQGIYPITRGIFEGK